MSSPARTARHARSHTRVLQLMPRLQYLEQLLRDIDQTPHECVCTGFHSYRVIVHSLSQGDALLKADKHNFDDAITAWTRGASARLPPRALRTAVASGTRAPAFLHSAPTTCHGKQQILVIRNRRHVADSSLAVWTPQCHTSRSVVDRAILIPAVSRAWGGGYRSHVHCSTPRLMPWLQIY